MPEPSQVFWLGLAFARITALLMIAPPFRGRNVPFVLKAGLALLLALLLQSTTAGSLLVPTNAWAFAGYLLREVAIGVSIGFMVQLFFFAVGVAGQLVDTEMGFHMAHVLDPMAENQLPLMGNLFSMLSLLLYLSLNGHLLLLRALAESFYLLPVGELGLPANLTLLIASCVRLLLLAVQIALPVIGASLFTSLMFGIMAKSVPQMNVFIVGMPLKIIILSVALLVALPSLMLLMEKGLGDVMLRLADWMASRAVP
ncbi:MAG: flagellar biosynthetic protein FliR [Firmicutes bacterium]|nr:flagellar biosynthetic protein FliR [Bacillota bacterium]